MKAITYRSDCAEGVELSEMPHPMRASGEALCRVVCSGVNPVDAKYLFGDKQPKFLAARGRKLVEGRIAGIDFAGVVEQVPEDCTHLKPGDPVFGTAPPGSGTFAEYVATPIHQVAHKPESLSFEEAAVLPLVGLTAIQSLQHDNGLGAGQHLLLIGASGGVGHVALQVAKALNARVTAICSGKNRDLVTRLGADHVADYTEGFAILDSVLQEIIVDHGRFDLCLDCVSSLDAKDAACDYEAFVRQNHFLAGTYICIGGRPIDWFKAVVRRRFGVNLFGRDRELFWVRFPHSERALEQIAEIADAGKIRPKVAEVLPLSAEGARQAFAMLRGRRVAGKLALRC